MAPPSAKPCAILRNLAAIVQNLQKSLPSIGTSDPCSNPRLDFVLPALVEPVELVELVELVEQVALHEIGLEEEKVANL